MPSQVRDMAVAAAAREGVSLSAWISEAVRRQLMLDDGLKAMMEWELENGPFSEEEIAAANAEVDAELERLAAATRKNRKSA
jgi:hypothetical protein